MLYRFGGLIFGGAYTWGGLFSELYGIYPGVNQIPVTASVTCDREELQKAGVSGY